MASTATGGAMRHLLNAFKGGQYAVKIVACVKCILDVAEADVFTMAYYIILFHGHILLYSASLN